eukprot:sb/3467209/
MSLNRTLILLSWSICLDGTSVVINLWTWLVQEYKRSFNATSNHPPTTTFSLQLPPNYIMTMPYYYDLPELRPVAPELEVPELVIPSNYTNKRPLSPTSSSAKFDCSPVKRSRANSQSASCYNGSTVDLNEVYKMSHHYPPTHHYPDMSLYQPVDNSCPWRQDQPTQAPWRQDQTTESQDLWHPDQATPSQAPWKQDQATPSQAPWRQDQVVAPSTALSKVVKKVSSIFKKSSAKKPAKTITQKRKKRTVFTAEELAILNSYYEVNKFLNPGLKAEILEKIDVPGNVLVMWYQNKRAKDRANGMII